ncbi:Zinc finger CCCH domain-containing protein [Actinidia chinensis var. chinensis]|uniref:Zinc finger CCCH domain-containing protein n=1 Tax=Actinidia chinensis var. chinensis TaxID=1590841 RepID=A0A2R6QTM9_ACTCC|nr:Zinc finger CCCH domain-containing protein [Actinidia chinensis var. chinensis]
MMMGSVCAEQQHKFHASHQFLLNKKSLMREIDIPPRKLLSRRVAAAEAEGFSPREESILLQKFLPYNSGGGSEEDDDDADPYSSDHFRMYEFKVRRCTRSRSHDWTDCPFAHPGEKARRRDPRRFHYSGTVCADFRRGCCPRGDNCEFAHGVFECWLHPARYRTEACKDGKNCKRKVCFFAHSPRQLRLLPPSSADSPQSAVAAAERKYRNSSNHCCLFCHSVSASPTSTLMEFPVSPPSLSPPISPAKPHSMNWFSPPLSRYGDRFGSGDLSYKDVVITELMSSLEGMNVNEGSSHGVVGKRNLSLVDVNFNNTGDDQQQFVLSPSTPSPSGSGGYFSHGDSSSKSFIDERVHDTGLACPDLGWVNDLLT